MGKNAEPWEKFEAWYEAVFGEGALTEREKNLIALAVAHALQCPYCIDAYTQGCWEKGSNLGSDDRSGPRGLGNSGGSQPGSRAADAKRRRKAEHVMATASGSLRSREHPLASGGEQLHVLSNSVLGHRPFDESLAASGLHPLRATGIAILQINVGKLCNQTCKHCHVDAGPDRKEVMTRETMELCLKALEQTDAPTVDITGGAPELNPNFRWLVSEVKRFNRHVIDRCNLSICCCHRSADSLSSWPTIASKSLPACPISSPRNGRATRRRGFRQVDRSAEKVELLGLRARRIGARVALVITRRVRFCRRRNKASKLISSGSYGIVTGLLLIRSTRSPNMPISRFLEFLLRTNNYDRYMERLIQAYKPRRGCRVDVPRYAFSRMGRRPLRLRFQPNAGSARLVWGAGPHSGFRLRGSRPTTDRYRPALLRLRRRGRLELRRGDGLARFSHQAAPARGLTAPF